MDIPFFLVEGVALAEEVACELRKLKDRERET